MVTNRKIAAVVACLALVFLCVGSTDRQQPTSKPANTSPLSAGTATSVVFLCDGSGTMLYRIDALREHLKAAVRSLSPMQRFDITVFADDRVTCFKSHLVEATERNVAESLRYIDRAVVARGETHPALGIKRALSEEPALIVLGTDGIFQKEDVDEIRVANLTTHTPINVVQYIEPEDDDPPGKKLARAIAKQSGGQFSAVEIHKSSR